MLNKFNIIIAYSNDHLVSVLVSYAPCFVEKQKNKLLNTLGSVDERVDGR